MMMNKDLTMRKALPQEAVDALLEKIKTDYRKWNGTMGGRIEEVDDIYREEMSKEFEKSVHVVAGSKYLKVVVKNSVHSFICLQDNGKFKRGDILKPASWRGPATNFARGNVLDGTLDRIRWTGAL